MKVSPAQISLIHGLKKRAALDDDAYRDVLRQTAGVASARDLSTSAAGRVIDRLKVLVGDDASPAGPRRAAAEGALALEGPFVGKLRALWLTAWNLGLVEDRSDRALAAFVVRQTGISSPSWVREPADARKAIEALKSWITRESGLVWPKDGRDLPALKTALVKRQWMILVESGQSVRFFPASDLADYLAEMIRREDGLAQAPVVPMTLEGVTPERLDRLASALGAKIRKRMGEKR